MSSCLPLYPAVQLDVLAVVVDVVAPGDHHGHHVNMVSDQGEDDDDHDNDVARVVDVQRHVLVLQVLLQPALVGLATSKLLVHLCILSMKNNFCSNILEYAHTFFAVKHLFRAAYVVVCAHILS